MSDISRFSEFLLEASNEDKLKHLEHPEDHMINAGAAGYSHAVNTLYATHHLINRHRKSPATITTKYDGSPSVVFGIHPEKKKFFVASKSAFNKDSKLNFSSADIDRNHGHAPGLVSKLRHALTHLPKVTPASGIFQGDFMYAKKDADVREDDKEYHFKPNTITYSAKKDTIEGAKIKKSKIGVVVHTKYEGDSFDHMKAKYNSGSEEFADHPDVHLMTPKFDAADTHYPPGVQHDFHRHMEAAAKAQEKIKDYSHLEGHQDFVKQYINSTYKGADSNEPGSASLEGYRSFLSNRLQGEVGKLKSPKAIEQRRNHMHDVLSHVDTHATAFQSTFDTHKHLEAAKNVLVHTLASAKYPLQHSINGQPAKPEGHVVVINNRPTKLVDRNEFSRANFAKQVKK